MVDILREKGVTNTAYVWQSTGFMSSVEQLEDWYPGDEYVDWLGVSFFNMWPKISMFEFARKKVNPSLSQKQLLLLTQLPTLKKIKELPKK